MSNKSNQSLHPRQQGPVANAHAASWNSQQQAAKFVSIAAARLMNGAVQGSSSAATILFMSDWGKFVKVELVFRKFLIENSLEATKRSSFN
jgi:hypothetical protein